MQEEKAATLMLYPPKPKRVLNSRNAEGFNRNLNFMLFMLFLDLCILLLLELATKSLGS